ncbi:MAG: hypothetical protein WCD37_10035 [Chloroflexia bacterium]
MISSNRALSSRAISMVNYLYNVLTQPLGSWEGFYIPQSQSMNFALRYQLAFSTYALAALQQATPAYRAPYAEAMRGAIEKMLHADVWGYWRAPQPHGNGNAPVGLTGSGHVAVLVSPHQRTVAGPPSDPIARDNLQYSGHLSAMLGLYEKVSGDSRYDNPFTLSDSSSGVEFSYTHGKVAERIHSQMVQNRFGGVCCEQGMAYVPCNNHAMASNTLHDALHGTRYRQANAGWLKTVRDRLVLKGPAIRGVFGTAYMKDLGLATPVAFNFTDAWGLAFMVPFARPLVRKLYGRFKKRGVARAAEGAYVGSSPVSERMEISDVAINTGFGLVLARGMGDVALSEALSRYSTHAFGAGWRGASYFYAGAPRTLHATALYALAEAIEPGGEGFTRLFNNPPDPGMSRKPYVASVASLSGHVGVSRASFDEAVRTLHIGIRQVGDPAALRASSPLPARVTVGNVGGEIQVEGATGDGVPYNRLPNGDVTFDTLIPPNEEALLTVHMSQ